MSERDKLLWQVVRIILKNCSDVRFLYLSQEEQEAVRRFFEEGGTE